MYENIESKHKQKYFEEPIKHNYYLTHKPHSEIEKDMTDTNINEFFKEFNDKLKIKTTSIKKKKASFFKRFKKTTYICGKLIDQNYGE
jgi:hypothetical protein